MRYLLPVLFLLLPFMSNAALLFSEIAWMGTDEDANNEWIEIYNFGNTPTDVTGWTITDGASLTINLSGTMGPHGVALLERTDDTSVPGVEAFGIYTGALANTGATLTLRDQNGTVIEEAVGGTDWSLIGGSNVVPKKTAQRTRTGAWVTAAPTPGGENAQVSDVIEEEDDDTNDVNNESDDEEEAVSTRTRSGGSSSKRTSIVKSTAELTITLTAADVVYVNQPVAFTTTATGPGRDIVNSLVYTWNFGDTFAGTGKAPTHTYVYPGEYVVVVNAKYGRHDVTVQKPIRVLPVGVTISRTSNGDVVLTNSASHDIDISGYILKGTESVTLPPNTYLLNGGSITIARSRLMSSANTMIALYDTNTEMVASELPVRTNTIPQPALALLPTAPPQMAPQRGTSLPVTKPVAVSKSSKDEVGVQGGLVAGESTVFEGLTIPVYAAEDDRVVTEKTGRNVLPYAGLVTLIVIAIVLLYRRPLGSEGK